MSWRRLATTMPLSPPSDARRVSALVGLLFGLAGMGSSSAAIALPVLARDLDVSTGVSAWAISLYALMLAVATAVYGRVSDLRRHPPPAARRRRADDVGCPGGLRWPRTSASCWPPGSSRAPARPPCPRSGWPSSARGTPASVRGAALGRVAGVAAAVSCLGPLAGGSVEGLLGWRAVIALPMLGALLVPLLWRSLPTDGQRCPARPARRRAGRRHGRRCGAAGAVARPRGRWSPRSGAALVVLGVPAVAWWVRRRPHGFLPTLGDPQPGRRAQRPRPRRRAGRLVRAADRRAGRAGRRGWEPWLVGVALLPSAVTGLLAPRLAGPLLARLGPAHVAGAGRR